MFLNDTVSNQAMNFSISKEPYGTLYSMDFQDLPEKAKEDLQRIDGLSPDAFQTLRIEDYED